MQMYIIGIHTIIIHTYSYTKSMFIYSTRYTDIKEQCIRD